MALFVVGFVTTVPLLNRLDPPPGSSTLDLLVRPPRAHLRFRLAMLASDPAYLATVIRYYVEHPERRAGIGTVAEHERLRAALAAGADAPHRLDPAI
jgi:hypothetical protein